jgi:release factor H-coupled RctB family protein
MFGATRPSFHNSEKIHVMHEILHKNCEIKLISSEKNWIEGKAVHQLNETAKLRGMVSAVGLPDLHPGKYGPVGAAFLTQGLFYPHLVGTDVGCGVGLWATDIPQKRLKLDRWTNKLYDLEDPGDEDTASWLATEGVEPTGLEDALGTIGGGNHFAKLQAVGAIEDLETFRALGLRHDRLVLTVHSGSRRLGAKPCRMDRESLNGLKDGTPEAA